MKLFLDTVFDDGIKEYLLKQKGIKKISITTKDFVSNVDISCDNEITPAIVIKFIELYLNEKVTFLMGFDKDVNYGVKKLVYSVDDMCCEYCYKALINQLFVNENIKSAKSNFDFSKRAYDTKLSIEFNEVLDEKEIIKYITDKI